MNEEEQTSSVAPSEAQSRRKAAKDAVIESGKVAAALVAIIGVVSAVLGVLFVVNPNWAPWTTFRGELKDAEIAEHNSSLIEYAERPRVKAIIARSPQGQPEGAAQCVSGKPSSDVAGNVVRFRSDVEGYEGTPLYVVWTLYEQSGTRVSDSYFQEEFGWPTGAMESENRLDISNAEIFVPLPPRGGTYYANIELWDKGDEEWFDESGCRVGGYDEWGNPEEDKSLKCRLILVKSCETASRLASINTEEFEVKLDASGQPRSTKAKGSDSSNRGETKSSEADATPITQARSSSGSSPAVTKADEKANAEAHQKELPKTGGPLYQTPSKYRWPLVGRSSLFAWKAFR